MASPYKQIVFVVRQNFFHHIVFISSRFQTNVFGLELRLNYKITVWFYGFASSLSGQTHGHVTVGVGKLQFCAVVYNLP